MSSSFSGLRSLLAPTSIAVVGASTSPTKVGGRPIQYLQRTGYQGKVYAVNPTQTSVLGLPSYPSIHSIEEPIDLAIVALPAEHVEPAIRQIAGAGVRSSILFSAGYAEIGSEGKRAQDRLCAIARESGLRLLGPNCLGAINTSIGMYATFSPVVEDGLVRKGGIAVVSQSGAFGGYAYSLARERGLGLSYWVTTGNESDIDVATCVDWLADDAATRVIALYIEGCSDGDALVRALERAQQAGKPIVAMKVGRSAIGAQAAASHTAALAGSDAVYDSVLKQYGVFRAETIEELFDLAYAFSCGRPLSGKRLGAFTVSGGVGVMIADAAEKHGMQVPVLGDAAQSAIRSRVAFAGTRNPVDATGQVTNDLRIIDDIVSIMAKDGQFDCLISFLAAYGLSERFGKKFIDVLDVLDGMPEPPLAVFCSLFTPEMREQIESRGGLAFEDPARAVRAIAALAAFGTMRSTGPVSSRRRGRRLQHRTRHEADALAVISAAGLSVAPHQVVRTAEGAAASAEKLGFPVAIKVLSPDIAHKSDCGGVRLNVRNAEEARAGFEEVSINARRAHPDAAIDGAIVMQQVPPGVECFLGVHMDPVFGPIVAFGLGGIFVELLGDVVLRRAPFGVPEAKTMIAETGAAKLLAGARGRPPADVDALAQGLAALSQLAATSRSNLVSIDVNPFVVRAKGEGAIAVDALVVTRGANEGEQP